MSSVWGLMGRENLALGYWVFVHLVWTLLCLSVASRKSVRSGKHLELQIAWHLEQGCVAYFAGMATLGHLKQMVLHSAQALGVK